MPRTRKSSSRAGLQPEPAYHAEPGSSSQPIDPAIDPRLYDSSYLDTTLDGGDVVMSGLAEAASMSLGQRRLLQEQVDLSESNDGSDEEDQLWDGTYHTYGHEPTADLEDEDDQEYIDASSDGHNDYDANADSPRPRKRRRGNGRFSGRYGARGGKGIKRGPRRPLEPSPEFKVLHSQALTAFIDEDYDLAIDLVQKAILVNPEMFAAHSLLSEIWLARGDKERAVSALFSGAHTRPRDPSVWYNVAKLIQEKAGTDRQKTLNDMIYCYSRIVEIDPKNFNARFQRAAAYRELGHNGRAVVEYERILKELPHNIRALRHLAETYIDMNDVQKATQYYMSSIEYYMSLDAEDNMQFSWSDVNICAELFAYMNQPESGLHLLSSVSRWLLGRKDDIIWNDIVDDDREWDAADSPRRIKTDGFIPDTYPIDSYGLGLPMELRIKLGAFRLKLGQRYFAEGLTHFEWLNPDDTSETSSVFDYADLYREAADALKDAGLFEQALRYYKPLQLTEDYADVSFFLAMGDCAFACENHDDAEFCYLTVVENDSANIQSRVNLAKLYEQLGEKQKALYFVNQAVLLGRDEYGGRTRRRRRDRRIAQLAREFQDASSVATRNNIVPRYLANATRETLPESDKDRPQHVQYLYSKMVDLRAGMRAGNVDATEDWLDIADALLRDFRSNRVFYPLQKNMNFLGYSREEQLKAGKKKDTVMEEMQLMAGRLQQWLGQTDDAEASIPTDYYGISFDEWLEMFLEYAFVVSGQGENEEAYNVLTGAADANVFYHSKDKLRQIHLCWITCALRLHDEETLVSEARWFTKEYQFVTDAYRLFSMLSKLCGDPTRSLFHASPSMKYMLRQVKAMDSTLPDDHHLKRAAKIPPSKTKTVSLTSRDENGDPITADEMDVALLVLYGHILYSGNSFYPALNYYLRAYALDPKNPAILLSIALCYVHHSLKRQAENRHYLILQGLSFMSLYRKAREKKISIGDHTGEENDNVLTVERQEVQVNFGRVYNSLGLLHQAVPCYERALELGDQIRAQSTTVSQEEEHKFVEDFSPEAAMALQNIYALNGNFAGARRVTEKYLVI